MSFVYDSESSIDGSLTGEGNWEASSEDSLSAGGSLPSRSKASIDLDQSLPTYNEPLDQSKDEYGDRDDPKVICNQIANFLQEKGFAVMTLQSADSPSFTAWAHTVFPVVMELCDRVEVQRSAISQVSSSSRKEETSKDALNQKVTELQTLVHDLEQREKQLQIKVSLFEKDKEVTVKGEKNTDHEHKKKVKNLQAQVQEFERKMRQKEIEFERLREKLHALSLKDVQTNSRNKELLTMVEKGDYSMLDESFSSRSSKASSVASSKRSVAKAGRHPVEHKAENLSQLIEAMDSNRRTLIARNKELELQVRDLTKQAKSELESKSGSDSFLQKDKSQLDASDVSNLSEKEQLELLELREICEEQEEKIEGLLHKLEVARSMQNESEYQMEAVRKQNFELREAVENLRSELEARPNNKQWTRAQREIQELENKVHDLVLLRGETEEIAQWRKHLSTKDRIKVDKKNHELGLWLLESLPKTIMKETLQMVCRELDLAEISEIQASLTKLKAVVRMVPRMERFITKISSFIFDRNDALLERLGVKREQTDQSMEAVFPVVQRWWGFVQKCVDLEEFRESVGIEMFRARELLSLKQSAKDKQMLNDAELLGKWERQGREEWLSQDKAEVVAKIRDLVDLQVEIMQSEKSLLNAEKFIKDRPDVLVNRILGHVQYLFDIKSVDGVLPCLNQVYIFNEEMKNFMSAVKIALGKEKAAPNSVITADVLHQLTKLKLRS